jgi:arsenate reductase
MQTVLFACVHNAGRSQIAAALFNSMTDPERVRAISAGTEPAPRIHPQVVVALAEVGMHLEDAQPRKLTPAIAAQAQYVVTLGCGEACPVVPGAVRDDWSLPDPKDEPLDRVREIRDEIESRVRAFAARNRWLREPAAPA